MLNDPETLYDMDRLEEDVRKELKRRELVGYSVDYGMYKKKEIEKLTAVTVTDLEYLTGGKGSGDYLRLDDE